MQRDRHRIAIAWFPYHDHPWRSRSRSGFGQPTATQLSVRHRASQRRSLRRSRAFDDSVSPTVLGAGQPFVQLRPAPAAVDRLSGHSTRVGAAQDMIACGIELPAILQAGRWKSTAMVNRYGERLLAQRSAAAQPARMQSRE